MFLIISENRAFIESWKSVLQPHSGIAAPTQARASLAAAVTIAENIRLTLAVVDAAQVDRNALLGNGELARLAKRTRVLLAGSPLNSNAELAAIAHGVAGCCSGQLVESELRKIVDVVLKGGIWISRPALPDLLSQLRRVVAPATPPGPATEKLGSLTPREREIALCAAEGASNKLIAKRLSVSDVTVKAHLTAVFQKLGVSRRVELALLLAGQRPAVLPGLPALQRVA
jgi:DNA-binding NarL/FixJ family response regulator